VIHGTATAPLIAYSRAVGRSGATAVRQLRGGSSRAALRTRASLVCLAVEVDEEKQVRAEETAAEECSALLAGTVANSRDPREILGREVRVACEEDPG